MQIIVLNDHGSITGGAAQVAIASVKALADAGYDVTFVSSVAPVDDGIDHRKVRVINFGFHDLIGNTSRLEASIRGIWNSRCAIRLGSLLDDYEQKTTVVHLHTWTKSFSSSIVRETLRRGFKLVVTLHDYFSVCPNGGLYNYVTQKACNIAPLTLSCAITNCDARNYGQKIWRFVRHIAQNRVGGMPSHVEYFISVSNYSEALLRPYLPSTAQFFRVRNPIDVSKMPPANLLQRNIFSFVGRLTPEKGAVLFATAAKEADVQSIFIGTGPEDVFVSRANPAAELRGWNDRIGVIATIQASRALVFPSLWHETQGLVVTEAAALGVPAIVSDRCAAGDVIVDGETGFLFKAGDVNDLAKKMIILKNDSALAKRMGKTAYDRYWANPCTRETHVKELVECYMKMLALD